MFATAIRYMATKPKPKMKPIELKTPPEQTQTITRVIFDVLKEHGPLTISDTWDRVKIIPTGLPSIPFFLPDGSGSARAVKQKTHENSPQMDEGEAEAKTNMQSRRASQAIPIYNLVYKIQDPRTKAWECIFSAEVTIVREAHKFPGKIAYIRPPL